MQLQEPEGEAEAVPPDVDSGDVDQDRVDPVDVSPSMARCFSHYRRNPARATPPHPTIHNTNGSLPLAIPSDWSEDGR